MAVRLPRVSRRSQSGLRPGGGGPERYISARRAGSARRSYRDQLREIINHVATLDKFKSGFGNTPLRLAVEARPIGQMAGIGATLPLAQGVYEGRLPSELRRSATTGQQSIAAVRPPAEVDPSYSALLRFRSPTTAGMMSATATAWLAPPRCGIIIPRTLNK